VSAALIIVAYNDAGTLERCVESVRRSGFGGPVVIVDNASTDDTESTAHKVAQGLEGIEVIRSDTNLGYAGGVNLGVRSVQAEYLAVMNADCVVEGDWLGPCVDMLERNDQIAAVCPTVLLADGTGINAEGLLLHRAGFGFNRHLGHAIEAAAVAPARVHGVQGTAFVIRRTVLDEIGGWSERGFLYHEDVELSWAIMAAGYQVWHVPTPAVLHDYHLTMSPEKFFLLERNRIEMLTAYLGFGTRLLISPIIAATEVAVWLYAVRKRSGLAGAKWRSYQSVWSRRTGRRGRRQEIRRFRTVKARSMVREMALRYPRSQTRTLHRGSPKPGRRGGRDMPTQ
jgi:GT2 family glycosyltransferase